MSSTLIFEPPSQPAKPAFDPLNQCRLCGGRAGKFLNQETYQVERRFLYVDARGGKCCNLCKDKYGDFLAKRKMTKAERKRFTKMKHELRTMGTIKHVTLDAKGKEVV